MIILGILSCPRFRSCCPGPCASGIDLSTPIASRILLGSPASCAEAAPQQDRVPPREYLMGRMCQSGGVVRYVRGWRVFCGPIRHGPPLGQLSLMTMVSGILSIGMSAALGRGGVRRAGRYPDARWFRVRLVMRVRVCVRQWFILRDQLLGPPLIRCWIL